MYAQHGRKRGFFSTQTYPYDPDNIPMGKFAFATIIYGFILLTLGALVLYSTLLWREFLSHGSEPAVNLNRPPRPVFSWPHPDAKAVHPVQDRLQVYRDQLIVQLRRVQLDKRAENEATKGNVYRIPSRLNRRRPKYLLGPKEICSVPPIKLFRRGDEPFRSQGSDLYFPQTSLPAYNSCAIVSSAGSMLTSKLGTEIDSHDAVLRFNNAPSGGSFAADVGSRTTHRILNSQVVSKPEFDFFESPLYRNLTLLVWDASKYKQDLNAWFEKPEHDVFSSYFLRRQIIPEENFYIIDPRSLWAIWDFLDLNSNLPVIKNPPSSGLLGLAFMLRHCDHVNFYEYIPSMRLTRRCHYYSEHEDMGCTTGVWHPLAAEKLLVLNMTTSSNEDIFATGKITFSRKEMCK